jgi:regulator of replication initiation timing
MQTELDALESKLTQLLEQHHVLRTENLKLRQQVVSQENANKQLSDKLAEARARLETLVSKLPD